ncbi:MAG: Ig-like domain repeat protein [Chloroflexi bacterium]|nr:Ig-like domain repeat protein [Chloroflexota bacterium]
MHPGSRARVVVAVLAALLAIPFAPVVPARAAELPTVTVTPSDATTIYGDPVTFAAAVAGTAGEATGTIQFAVDGTDLGDPVTLTGGSASSDAITTLEVGTHAITAHFSSADTDVYESADGTLVGGQEIARAELTVEPDPKTVAYGSAAPAYTFQVNGFVLGESAATADGYVAPSCSSDYTGSTPVASSPRTIACSGGSADNYQFNYETAALTISKADQTTLAITGPASATYGAPDQAISYTGGSGIGTITFDEGSSTACSIVAGQLHVTAGTGTCTITATKAGISGGTSTTVVASNHNPSVFGQAVTFTATVSGGGATPTGTVTFRDGASTLGTGALNGSGVATLTTSALSVATHSITAAYGGSASYSASTSSTLSQVVGKASTTLGLASSDASSVYGQTVTFTATVSVTAPGGGSASGTVQFRVDGVDFGAPVAVAGGLASVATPALGAGSHEITAVYSGDGNLTGSSTTLAGGQTVAKATLTVRADPATREYGQANPVFSATISGFVNGESLLTSGVSGSPTCSSAATESSSVSGSPYAITCVAGSLAAANYDFAFASNGLVIDPATSTVALVSDHNPAVPNQPASLTATVTGLVTALPAPGGSIEFQAWNGATWTHIDTQALVSGFSASTAVSLPAAEGEYQYRARFTSPDGNFADGTGELVQLVGRSPVTVTITASRPTWETNVPLVFTATITPDATGATVPITGSVDFTVDGGAVRTVAVSSGAAALPAVTFATAGVAHTVTAAYRADATGSLSYQDGTALPLTATVAANIVNATGVGVSSSSIYPYRDTWHDTVDIRGTRNERLAVTITIYKPTGSRLLTKTIAAGSGAYKYTWTGKYSSGAMLPAGRYRIVQTLADGSGVPALRKSWSSFVSLSTKRMYWTTVSLYRNANAPSRWSGAPSRLTSTRYRTGGATMMTATTGGGSWAAFGYSFTLPSATTVTKVAFYVQGGPWSGPSAPKVGLNDWRPAASFSYGGATCVSTDWCQMYNPTRARRSITVSTPSSSWYGISGDPAAVVRTVSGKRYVRGFVDTGSWVTGLRYDFARVRLIVTYGVLK